MGEGLGPAALVVLGALHGLNPAMGWLFAVALGLQHRSRAAVFRALGPIALGHALSVALVIGLVRAAGMVLGGELMRHIGASAVVIFGVYKLLRPSTHPRWVGMRVGPRDLTLWSFLMSTAHGAGLMLLPLALRLSDEGGEAHAAHGGLLSVPWALNGYVAVGLHTLAMLAVMTAVALAVYQVIGLAVLRGAWLNLDRLWAAALIAAGAISLVWR